MSLELLERGARALGPVLSDVVFLGGASIVLWITDPAAPAPRPTKDVDVVAEVTSRASFHDFEARLRTLGFKEDQQQLVLPTLALSPPALDHVRRDEREASEDREALWLGEAVAALKDEPRERPEKAGESRVSLGSVPLAGPK